MLRFKEFIKEASDFHYFTGKNVVGGFLNQAPEEKTRSYDSGTYKKATIDYITADPDNVKKEDEDLPEIDVNYSDDLLMTFEEFKNYNSKFYHVTLKDNLKSILKNGITLNNSKTFKELKYPNAVYFSSTINGAKMNLIDITQYLKLNIIDMIVVEFKILDNINIIEDTDMGNDSYYILDSIKPTNILNIYEGEKFLKMR